MQVQARPTVTSLGASISVFSCAPRCACGDHRVASSSGDDVNRLAREKGADVLHRHHEHAFDGFDAVKRGVRREDDVRLREQPLIAKERCDLLNPFGSARPGLFRRRCIVEALDNLVSDDFAGVLSHNAFFFEHIESCSADNSNPRHRSKEKRVSLFTSLASMMRRDKASMSANVCSATVFALLPGSSQTITLRREHSLTSIWSWPADLVVISLSSGCSSRNAASIREVM